MKYLNQLERRFGKYAPPHLMTYLCAMYAAGLLIQQLAPELYYEFLMLNPPMILSGQIWRLVTFILWPPYSGLLSNCIMIFLYYSVGNTLEQVWGSFRFDLYMLVGILGHILAGFIGWFAFHQIWLITTGNLNMSLLLAFAAIFPDLEFRLYFLIPIKAKWLGIFYAVMSFMGLITGSLPQKIMILLSFANFFLFFFATRNYNRIRPAQIRRRKEFEKQARIRPRSGPAHRCAVCGRTEADGADLEFRYCSKCSGEREYCSEHLYTHVHVTEDGK